MPLYIVGSCVGLPLVPFGVFYRSENMPFLTILLNPICQSRPKLGQNSQNHYYLCKSDFFCSNEANSNRKQLYWVSIGYWCKNCPFLVKCSISGLWNSRFWSNFDLINAFFTYNPPYTMNGMLEAPQGTFTGEIKWKNALRRPKWLQNLQF